MGKCRFKRFWGAAITDFGEIRLPEKAVDFMHPDGRDRLPHDWESTFGGYRYFYAPGVNLFIRSELELSSRTAFEKAAAEFRDEAPKQISDKLKSQVYSPQNDWESLGPKQIKGLFGTANLVFAKLVVGLVVVQMIANKKKVKVNVFERFPFHAAIFHFANFDPKFFREEIIQVDEVFREFSSRVFQKKQFAESFAKRHPATLRTVRVMEAWMEQTFPDRPQGTIFAHDERKQTASEKETVAAEEPSIAAGPDASQSAESP